MTSDAYTIWRNEERNLRRTVRAPRQTRLPLRERRLRLANWLRLRGQLARHQRTIALLAFGMFILLFLHFRNHALNEKHAYAEFVSNTEREALAAIRSGGRLSGVIHNFDDGASLKQKYDALNKHLAEMRDPAQNSERKGAASATPQEEPITSSIVSRIDPMFEPGSAYHFLYFALQLGAGIAIVAGLGSLLLGSHVEAFQKLADMFRDTHGTAALLVPSVVLGTVAVASGHVAGSRSPPSPAIPHVETSSVTWEALQAIGQDIRALQENLESAIAYRAFHRTEPQPVSLWMMPEPPGDDAKMIRYGIDTLKVSVDTALAYNVFRPHSADRAAAWGDPRLYGIDSQMKELHAKVDTLASAKALSETTKMLAGTLEQDLAWTTSIARRLAIQRLADATGASPESFVLPRDYAANEAIHRQLDHLETSRIKTDWWSRPFWQYVDPPVRACTRGMFSSEPNIEDCRKCTDGTQCMTANVETVAR